MSLKIQQLEIGFVNQASSSGYYITFYGDYCETDHN